MELRGHTPRAARSLLVLCLALLVLVPTASAQSNFAFLQPLSTAVQCQPYAFAWTGGTPPYSLQVSVSSNWGRAYGISGLAGPGFPWTIPVPAGYAVSFELFDNASHVTSAGPLTIQSSDDTSCFSKAAGNGSSSPSSTSTSSTIASSTTSTSSTTTLSTTTSSTTTSSTPDPPTTSTSTSTTPTSQPPTTSSSSSSSSSFSPSLTPFNVSGSGSPASTQPPPTTSFIQTTIMPTRTGSASTSTSSAPPPPSPHPAVLSTGAAAGIAVAGTAALVLAGVGAVWCCRARRRRRATPGFGAGTDLSAAPDSDAPLGLRAGGPQMSEARLGPLPPASSPSPSSSPSPYSPPSSSGRGSDPFASDRDGSRQLLLHAVSDSEDSALPLTLSSSASARRRRRGGAGGADVLTPSPGVTTDDSILKPPVDAGRARLASPHSAVIDIKPDSLPSARDLPIPPPPPTHPPRAIAQSYAAVPTHEHSASELEDGAMGHGHMMRFEEDGGVRLAGGLPGEVLGVDEAGGDPGGWVVQPPPYQRFR